MLMNSSVLHTKVLENIYYDIMKLRLTIISKYYNPINSICFVPPYIKKTTKQIDDVIIEISNPNDMYSIDQLAIISTIDYIIDYFIKSVAESNDTKSTYLVFLELFKDDSIYNNALDFILYNKLVDDRSESNINIPYYCTYNLIKYILIYRKLFDMSQEFCPEKINKDYFPHIKFSKHIDKFLSINNMYKSGMINKTFCKKSIDSIIEHINIILDNLFINVMFKQ